MKISITKSLKTPLLWSVLSRTKRSGGWGRLSLFLLPLLIASKCFKEPEPTDPIDQLPPATQEGKNTFGCLVNGEVYLPKGGGWGTGVPALTASYGGGAVFITSNNAKTDKSIALRVYGIEYKAQTIPLVYTKEPLIWAIYHDENSSYVIDDSLYIGELIFTRLDTIENIASGTFWFDAVNENDSTDVIHITDGRFDVRL